MAANLRYDFTGQAAVVTGGSRGIGRGVAEALAAAGARVHVFDRDLPQERPPHLGFHAVDVTDSNSVAAAVKNIEPAPTLLVNNAGITRDRSIMKMSDDEWRSVLEVNLTGAFNMIRALAPGMAEAGRGSIVNVASINGMRGKFGQANYAASKGGLIALTKTAAKEFGRKGITVNAVAPGMVLTEMTLALEQKFRDAALAEAALPHLPDVEDMANAILFLLSDAARTVTGQVLKVDSGQYI